MLKAAGFRILAATVSLVVLFAALELAFRILGIHGVYHKPRVDSISIRPSSAPIDGRRIGYGYPHSTIISKYDSDPRGYFGEDHEIVHEHNSGGFRDIEHSFEKPPGVYRIVGLGDSFLWGQGVKFEDISLNVLAKRLGETSQRYQIETINLAISGMDTVVESRALRELGVRFDPDLVILHFVLNDIKPSIDLYSGDFNKISNTPDALSKYSQLWSWARKRYLAAVTTRRYIDTVVADAVESTQHWQITLNAIDEINETCNKNNIKLLVAIYPFFYNLDDDYPFQIIHDRIEEHCRERGIDVIDLKPYFDGLSGPELWVHPVDQHPNEEAHRIVAEALYTHLVDKLQ